MNRNLLAAIALLACWAAGSALGCSPAHAADGKPSPGTYPNAAIQVSVDLANLMLQRDFQRKIHVTRQIMGATTVGQALMEGKIRADLVPSEEQAVIRLTLDGANRVPDGVAYRRRVTVYSSSDTKVDASKQIAIDGEGLHLAPTLASVATTMSINGVAASLRLVERLADRRTARMRPEMEAAISAAVARSIEEQVDREADKPLRDLNTQYLTKVRQPLIESGCFPRFLRFHTTPRHAVLWALHQNPGQRTPPLEPLNLDMAHDIAVYGHQTLVINFLESFLGGKTATDRHFQKFMETLTGGAPRQLWVHDRRRRWSIDLADEKPFDIRFAEGHVTIEMFGNRTTWGEETLEAPWEVKAVYSLEATDDGPRMVRLAPAEVRFRDNQPEREQRSRFRQLLERKLNAFFAADLYFDALIPPEGGEFALLRQLQLKELTAAHGWFKIGYQLRREKSSPAETLAGLGVDQPETAGRNDEF